MLLYIFSLTELIHSRRYIGKQGLARIALFALY